MRTLHGLDQAARFTLLVVAVVPGTAGCNPPEHRARSRLRLRRPARLRPCSGSATADAVAKLERFSARPIAIAACGPA